MRADRMTRWLLAALLAAPVAVAADKDPNKPQWANKLFLPDIGTNPKKDPPAFVAHDFGSVPAGTVCSHTFTLTNIYDVPLQVVDVRLECGCLKAFPPNKVLQPNEAAEFTVTMNAGQFKGAATKKVLVTVGPGYVSTAELRLSATSREDVSLTAPGQIDFGIVPQGQKAEKSITLKYTGAAKDWKVESAAVSGSACTVEVKEAGRGFLSTDYTITVGLKDTAPAGPVSETVTLKTNDPATPAVTVAVGGSVQPPVSAHPERVVFEGVKAGEVKELPVLIRATADCTLTAVADNGDGVSVETFPQSRQIHKVTVRYEAPTRGGGPLTKVVRVKTDLPGRPEVSFTVEVR